MNALIAPCQIEVAAGYILAASQAEFSRPVNFEYQQSAKRSFIRAQEKADYGANDPRTKGTTYRGN